MLGTKDLSDAMLALLAADPATLNAGAGLEPKVVLFKADFVEDRALVLVSSYTEADFPGYAAIAAGAGVSPVNLNPLTNEWVLTIKEPAGGWRWVQNAPNPPQTIYGYALVNSLKTHVYAVHRFDDPIGLALQGHFVEVGEVKVTQVLNPLN